MMKTDTERQVEVPWLIDRLGHPKRILDIGSAGAHYLPDLTATGAIVHLVDTRTIKRAPATAVCHQFSVTALPVAWNNHFDLVTCVSVLDHIGLDAYGNESDAEALETAVSEMRRVTKVGGRLLLTVPTGRDLITTHPGGGQRVFSISTLGDLFPHPTWQWLRAEFWRLLQNRYVPCDHQQVMHAGYAGHRAEAVVALELVKHE